MMTAMRMTLRLKARFILLFFGVALMTGWWELMHELTRDWLLERSWQSDLPALHYFFMTMHCPSRALGILVGAGAFIVASKRHLSIRPDKVSMGIVAVLCLLDILHFLAMDTWDAYGFGSLVHLAANALVVVLLLLRIRSVGKNGTDVVFVGVAAFVSALAAVNLMVLPALTATASPIVPEIARLGFLAGGAICLWAADRVADLGGADERHVPAAVLSQGDLPSKMSARVQRPLIVHLVLFGVVLGFLHTVGRRLLYGASFSTDAVVAISDLGGIPLGVGAVATLLVVAWLYGRKRFRFSDVWNLVRKLVYTLAVLEFLLVPILATAFVAVLAGDTAFVLYQALFMLGCFYIYRESDEEFALLLAWGLFLLAVGQSLSGVLLESVLGAVVGESTFFALLRVTAFLLCTIGAFWVGSDEEIRKLWGLRHEYLPKRYNDEVVLRKCEQLGRTSNLTPREVEMMFLVAQGLRTKQIAEHLCISPNTVRTHIQNAYGKLDIHSASALTELLANVEVEI